MSRTWCGWVGPTGITSDALGPDEIAVVVDPAPIAVRVELADEQDPGVVAMLAPVGEQRLQRPLLGDRQVGAVRVGRLEQDVEVADRPEPRGDLAQAVAVALRAPGPERGAEDAPGGPLPAGRDAHRVELLRIRALARAGLAGEHPGEVELMTLRPASATWSSAVTPGVLPTTRRVSTGAASSAASSMTSEEVGVTTTGSGTAACGRRLLGSSRVEARSRRRADRRVGVSAASACWAWRPSRALDAIHRLRVIVPCRPPERTAASAASSLLPLAGASAGSAAKMSASATSRSSAPLTSSASSSTNRSTTRERDDDIDLVEAQLDPRVAVAHDALAAQLADRDELERGASPASSSTSDRASDAGHSSGPAVRSAGSLELLAADRRRPGLPCATAT